jgi:hypothetical protein
MTITYLLTFLSPTTFDIWSVIELNAQAYSGSVVSRKRLEQGGLLRPVQVLYYVLVV